MNIFKRIYLRVKEIGIKNVSLYCIRTEIIRVIREKQLNTEILLRDSKAQLHFMDEIIPLISQIPDSNGCRYYEKSNIKVAIIADRFLYDCYGPVANLIYVTPDNATEYAKDVDFLFVASAWSGLGNEWLEMSIEGNENNDKLYEIIAYYKKNNKTVAFYNKEDPPHYRQFLNIARKCDVIFTTSVEKIEAYKTDCNNEKVYLLPFGFNPILNNPIGMSKKCMREGAIFAGSWMSTFPERNRHLENIFDQIIKLGKELLIIDRNYSKNRILYFFPRKYYSNLVPEVEHDTLQKLHKIYQWTININSVSDSITMLPNRIYELLASGCLIISDKSAAIQKMFPEVFIINNRRKLREILVSYTDEQKYQIRLEGIRHVMKNDTCFDRFNYILEKIGIGSNLKIRNVLVVVDDITSTLYQEFQGQTYQYKTIIRKSELTQSYYEQFDCVAEWDSNISYNKYYLEDMINVFKYTDSDYVIANYTIENNYVEKIDNKYLTVFWRDSISLDEFCNMEECFDKKNGYSINTTAKRKR